MSTTQEIRNLTRAAVCVVVVISMAGGAFAGIKARRDGRGRYAGTSVQITPVKPLGHIWSDFNEDSIGIGSLNPGGDANGDLWPAVVENTVAPHHPWAVWSRFNGTDYDIAWARWRGARWTAPRSVHNTTSRGDDLDADLVFGGEGRPYLVWWRNKHGVGRVFLSIFLNSRWMGEIQISDDAIDSRNPTIEVMGPGRVVVEYETPDGLYARFVRFHQPVTITDDINPFSHVQTIGPAFFVRQP